MLVFSSILVSCKDEDLNPIVPWESGVHGYAKFTSTSPTNFVPGDLSKILDLNYQWVSIDGANTVNKMEFFITYSESYTDGEGNPRTANHGRML